MAKLAGFNIPQQFMTGFVAGVFSSVLVWIMSFIEPLAQKVIAMIQAGGREGLVTGTDLGTKLVEMLSGKLGFSEMLPGILIAGIGGGILVMLGTWIYNMKWSPDTIPGLKATSLTKMILVLLYASAAATLILNFGFQIPSMAVILTLIVNSVVTAYFIVEILGGMGLVKA